MTAPKPVPASLVSAAQTFEDELRHLEDLALQLERAPISSQKTLQRSGTLLEDAGRTHERLGECLAALIAAVETTRARQQTALDRVLAETRRVQTRNQQYRELMDRFAALGARANEANGPVTSIVAQKDAGATAEDLLQALALVESLTEGVVADAEAVEQSAREGDWPDIAREAQALRQSMHAARNKVSLARRGVAGRAPS